MIDVLDIQDQPLSSIFTDFYICQSSNIVDHNSDRLAVGFQCPICHSPSPSGSVYFPIAVSALIDLMQEFYH